MKNLSVVPGTLAQHQNMLVWAHEYPSLGFKLDDEEDWEDDEDEDEIPDVDIVELEMTWVRIDIGNIWRLLMAQTEECIY